MTDTLPKVLCCIAIGCMLSSCGGGASGIVNRNSDNIFSAGQRPVQSSARTGVTSTVASELPPPIGGGGKIVPDQRVDSVIDSALSPAEHSLVRTALLALPPVWRGNGVIIRTLDGKLHASSVSLLRDTLAKEVEFKGARVPGESAQSPVLSPQIVPNPTPSCSPKMYNLGGEDTGPFRRVYIGCMGFNTQNITFYNTACGISDSIQTTKDFHSVLGGAYSSTAGIDAGLAYINKGPGTTNVWEQFTSLNGAFTLGHTLPCGGGLYQISFQIQVVNGTTNRWVLTSSVGGNAPAPVIQDVTPAQFQQNGSNFIFRRLTGIGQSGGTNPDSTEWFGFADNGLGAPNRSAPQIEYTATTVSIGTGKVQFNSTNSFAERNPKDYSNLTGAICSHDPFWVAIDFNDYEGLNLNNPNASGTIPGAVCAPSGD